MGKLNGPLQDADELFQFCQLVEREKVESYLEIGSKFGGSLYFVTGRMPIGSRAVAVDIEGRSELRKTIADLKPEYDTHLLVGNSIDPKIVDAARTLGPYDLCLIDANHTEPYVRQDWLNFGPMARIVAFHDIAWDTGGRDRRNRLSIDVPKVWNEIKGGYRHREIKLCATGQDNGLGILWRS